MAKVVFIGNVFHGHVNPTIGLVAELVKNGETVIYYTIEPFRRLVENAGAIFRDMGSSPPPTQEDGKELNGRMTGFDEMVNQAGAILRENQLLMERIFPDIKREKPDYLIHDAIICCGKYIARLLNIPAISSIPTFALTNEMFQKDPTFLALKILGLSPDSPSGRFALQNSVAMLRTASKHLSSIFGIPDIDLVDCFMCKEELNILYTSRYLQFFSELLDEKYVFIGPSIYPRRDVVDFPLEKVRGNQVVYISLGTVYNTDEDFYRKSFHAFAGSDRMIVMSVGKYIEISSLGPIPDNFIVRNYVPQLEVLEHTGVFVTHGGMNSACEGLFYGTPLIVVPQGFDQYLVGHRVEELGAGLYLEPQGLRTEELLGQVERVLHDTTFRQNSEMIRNSFLESGGFRKAVAEIFAYKKRCGIPC